MKNKKAFLMMLTGVVVLLGVFLFGKDKKFQAMKLNSLHKGPDNLAVRFRLHSHKGGNFRRKQRSRAPNLSRSYLLD